MDRRDFEQWAQRFAPVVRQPDVAAAAADAGLELWGTEAHGARDGSDTASGRAGMIDPRTGQGAVAAAFAPAATCPPGYPPGWPFLPFVQTWLTEMRFGDAGSLWLLAWSDLHHPDAMRARITAFHRAAGWQTVDDPAVLARLEGLPQGRALAAFRLADHVRILAELPPASDGSHGLVCMELPAPPGEPRDGAAI